MKYLKYMFFVIVVGVIGYLSYGVYNSYKALNRKIYEIEYEVIQYREVVKQNDSQRMAALQLENTVIDPSVIRNDSIEPDVILRLHEGICMACYFNNVKFLIDCLDKKGKKILILGNYPNEAVFNKVLRDLGSSPKIQVINDKRYHNSRADDVKAPYLFRIAENNKIKNAFFIDKGDTLTISEYVKILDG